MATRRLDIILDATDRASGVMDRVEGRVQRFAGTVTKVTAGAVAGMAAGFGLLAERALNAVGEAENMAEVTERFGRALGEEELARMRAANTAVLRLKQEFLSLGAEIATLVTPAIRRASNAASELVRRFAAFVAEHKNEIHSFFTEALRTGVQVFTGLEVAAGSWRDALVLGAKRIELTVLDLIDSTFGEDWILAFETARHHAERVFLQIESAAKSAFEQISHFLRENVINPIAKEFAEAIITMRVQAGEMTEVEAGRAIQHIREGNTVIDATEEQRQREHNERMRQIEEERNAALENARRRHEQRMQEIGEQGLEARRRRLREEIRDLTRSVFGEDFAEIVDRRMAAIMGLLDADAPGGRAGGAAQRSVELAAQNRRFTTGLSASAREGDNLRRQQLEQQRKTERNTDRTNQKIDELIRLVDDAQAALVIGAGLAGR